MATKRVLEQAEVLFFFVEQTGSSNCSCMGDAVIEASRGLAPRLFVRKAKIKARGLCVVRLCYEIFTRPQPVVDWLGMEFRVVQSWLSKGVERVGSWHD